MDRLYVEGEKGAGLLLDPGLGKTVTTLSIIDQLRSLGEVSRVLVVAPLRVAYLVWPTEISKWGFDFASSILHKHTSGMFRYDAFIELINPESLHKVVPYADRYDLIVVDESYLFKSWSTKRMKYMRKMLPSIPRRLILTGTPTAYSLADMYSQSFILDDGAALGKNVTAFRKNYMRQGGWQGRQWVMREDKKKQLREAIAPMMLRLDAESNLSMPELLIHDVVVQLPDDVRREHARLKRDLFARLQEGTITAANQAVAYAKLRQLCNGAVKDADGTVHVDHKKKVDALQDILGELEGKQALIVYQFKADADMIQKAIGKCSWVRGGLTPAKSEREINRWLEGKTRCLLAQQKTCSHGLNLQTAGASDIIFYGVGDSPESFSQAYRRLYRQGAGSHVRVHRLVAENSVDELICARVDGKLGDQASFLDQLKSWASNV